MIVSDDQPARKSPPMNARSLTAALKEEALRLGFDLVAATPAVVSPDFERLREWIAQGHAGHMQYMVERLEARRHPDGVLPGVKSLLMLAANYRTAEPREAGLGQAQVSRYAWGEDYHGVIRRRLHMLADLHRRLAPGADVRGVVDTAPLLERQFARLAGLGWIGKNTLLINERFGSWLFLAALLSTAELAYDEPMATDRCGSCRACLDACPTGALCAPNQLDARRCLSYLMVELREPMPAEFRAARGRRIFGCDACQEACPWNRQTPTGAEPAFQPGPGMNPVELSELKALDEEAFRRRFRHTPLWRPGHEAVLRNAAELS
jgi:epoxyqueuosine reductase